MKYNIFILSLIMLLEINASVKKFTFANLHNFKIIKSHKLKKRTLRKKTIVIKFWASWCARCVSSLRKYQLLHKKYSSKRIKFISINLDENSNKARTLYQKLHLTFLTFLDEHQSLADLFQIKSIPALVILSPTKRIKCKFDEESSENFTTKDILKCIKK